MAPTYKTEKKTTDVDTQTILVEINHEGQLYLSPSQKKTVAAQWLMDAADGHLGQAFRQLGRILRLFSRYAGFCKERPQKVELRILNADLTNENAARLRFIQQLFALVTALLAQIECSSLIAAELSGDDKKRHAVSLGRRVGLFTPASKTACAEDIFPLTIDLEGVSDETKTITPRIIGVPTTDAFADAAQDAHLSEVLATLEWDHLAALKAHVEEAEQLKAAEELLDGRRLTVANVNRLLAKTDRSFTTQEKENLLRVVRYFENRERSVKVKEGRKQLECRFSLQPRSDASTLMFDIDARREGGKRVMRATLPEGLIIS